MPKIRNIIIFIAIAGALGLVYFFFTKASPDEGALVSSGEALPNVDGSTDGGLAVTSPVVASDFLALLLNVKTIKLDDAIFADPTFASLHDSTIVLTPDGTEGRPNPFAQFGNDAAPVSPGIPIQSTSPTPAQTTTNPTNPTSPAAPTTVSPPATLQP